MSEDMPSDSQQHRQQNKYYDLRCKRTRSSLDLPASSENFETLVNKGNAVVQSKVKRGSKGMDLEQFLLAFMESVTSRVHTFEQTGQGGFGVSLVDTFKRIFSEVPHAVLCFVCSCAELLIHFRKSYVCS